jgi:thioesterase domain-containing protein
MMSSLKHEPTSTMIEALTPIWQRVLERSPIRAEDNFFDLGGNPSLAIQLFAEITQVSGRELSPLMIYRAPTIAALAALLERPATARLPPLVMLKAGTEEPPVFIAHGLGGSIMEFFELLTRIRFKHPVHGMQAKGVDGADEPLERIEDMAQFYLDAIKELQPHGPYLLIGYSLGGLVTFEMAQRLTENGEKVALLAMLDSYPHPRYLSLRQRARLVAQQARHHASTLMQLPIREALSYIMAPSERRLHVSRNAGGSVPNRPPIGASTAAMRRVRDSANRALTRYRPRFYSGKIKFVRAETSSDFPDDPRAVWAKLAGGFEVETVPGDHLGMLTTHSESLASVLSRYVKEALGE